VAILFVQLGVLESSELMFQRSKVMPVMAGSVADRSLCCAEARCWNQTGGWLQPGTAAVVVAVYCEPSRLGIWHFERRAFDKDGKTDETQNIAPLTDTPGGRWSLQVCPACWCCCRAHAMTSAGTSRKPPQASVLRHIQALIANALKPRHALFGLSRCQEYRQCTCFVLCSTSLISDLAMLLLVP
jgi:hypothetical protein